MLFNVYEERIIRVLGQTDRGLTINEVATEAGISWITAREHLDILEGKGIVQRSKGLRVVWRLNFPGQVY